MKYKILLAIIILLSITGLFSLIEETGSLKDFMYGSTDDTDYDNWLSRTVEGIAREDYNQYAPWDRQTNEFGRFVNANAEQRANWGLIIDSFLAQNFMEAENLIEESEFPYEVVRFNDTDTNRTYFMLREQLNYDYYDTNGFPDNPEMHTHGAFHYGWGIYIFNPAALNHILVNIVHPNDDFITVPISTIAFQEWNARYFIVSGAGREVMWTNIGNYTNTKSLSDPSRNLNHTFNVAYQRICNEIRNTFNIREFSVQIHSYDLTHENRKPLQISAGKGDLNYPSLPIRDLSGNYLDLVNASPYIVIPANSIGEHPDITVDEYYSIHYEDHGFAYLHGEEIIEIPNDVNLPGYSNNHQVNYTIENWNTYDVYTPFFHIEFSELPWIYDRDIETYHWFYGFDAETNQWNPSAYFSNTIAFYTPWIEHLSEALSHLFNFNDNLPPTNPTNLVRLSNNATGSTLQWERSFSFDFKSYEILYSTEQFDENNPSYQIIGRELVPSLAAQAYETAYIPNLHPYTQYYFRIRARDYHNNVTTHSNMVSRYNPNADIIDFAAHGRDGHIKVSWTALSQTNNQGFYIWRKYSDSNNWDIIASWETSPNLAGSNSNNVDYSYLDNQIYNDHYYDYRISSVSNSNTNHEFPHFSTGTAKSIFSLRIANENVSDIIEFGYNPFARDEYDDNFDVIKEQAPNNNFIYANFRYEEWDTPYNLQRSIVSQYDPQFEFKTFPIRIRTDLLNQSFSLSHSSNYTDTSGRLFLMDNDTGVSVNIFEAPYEMVFQDNNYRYFTLYWGSILPRITFAPVESRYYQAGDTIDFEWSTSFSDMISYIDLYLSSEYLLFHLSNNLPNNTTSYQWTVPNNLHLSHTNFMVRAMIFGQGTNPIFDYHSPDLIGTIPLSYNYSSLEGWQLITNPYTESTPTAEEVFGENGSLFCFDNEDQSYFETNEFESDKAYWLFVPENITRPIEGSIITSDYSYNLYEGWNLIPNPYLDNVQSKDLNFVYGESVYSYADAVSENLVSRGIWTSNSNVLVLSERINTGRSFWVFAKVDNLAVLFKPFHKNNVLETPLVQWNIELLATQSDYTKDSFMVGSYLPEDTIPDADMFFNLPKPPAKPSPLIDIYLQDDDLAKLYSRFEPDLIWENRESMLWDFQMEVEDLSIPVKFRFRQEYLPAYYRVVLIINETFNLLSQNSDYLFYPQSNLVNGQIMVTIADLNTDTNLLSDKFSVTNYPNPFFAGKGRSGGTTISFNLIQDELVLLEIFNIKGQKVAVINNSIMPKGEHKLFWDGKDNNGKNQANGIYFYRLKAGNKKVINKTLMLK